MSRVNIENHMCHVKLSLYICQSLTYCYDFLQGSTFNMNIMQHIYNFINDKMQFYGYKVLGLTLFFGMIDYAILVYFI